MSLLVTQHQVRTANLLGVAGTDVPVSELKKRTPAYKVLQNLAQSTAN